MLTTVVQAFECCVQRVGLRANSLASIQSNYAILQDTWVEALGVAKDTETKARIIGVQGQMQRFNIFGITLGENDSASLRPA